MLGILLCQFVVPELHVKLNPRTLVICLYWTESTNTQIVLKNVIYL